MDKEILKALNNISKRLIAVEKKVEKYLLDKQEVTNGGLVNIADIISGHDEAIADLAAVVSEIAENQ